jgi:hypothetical protein
MNWESCEIMEFVYVLEKCLGCQSKPCIIYGGNLQHAHSGHSTTHLKIKRYTMVNKRDIKVFIVCLSCHFDVGLFHVIGHGGTPLAVLDDTCILTMTRACLGL